MASFDKLPVLMRPDEVTTIQRAAHYARKSELTIRRWCRQHGISRQATPNSPHEVSRLALEMVLQGDFTALELLRSGQREAPEVRRYIQHLKLDV